MREKAEKNLCGGYDLIYPIVSYAEEDMIRDRIATENPNNKYKVNDKQNGEFDSEEDETFKETESRVLDLL